MDETPDLPALLDDTTPLRELAIDGQELYTELRYAGFSDKQAIGIVAYMITDALDSRNEDDYVIGIVESEDDEEDDTYDDGDSSI